MHLVGFITRMYYLQFILLHFIRAVEFNVYIALWLFIHFLCGAKTRVLHLFPFCSYHPYIFSCST